MWKFEVGKKYFMTSVCDSDCRWEYVIQKRTGKSIWIDGKRFITRIYFDGDSEYIMPLGRYSMAPILKAEKEVTQCE